MLRPMFLLEPLPVDVLVCQGDELAGFAEAKVVREFFDSCNKPVGRLKNRVAANAINSSVELPESCKKNLLSLL
jgi:hypothetical protein